MISSAYLKPLVRWWRLIATVTLLALIASTISTFFQPALYESKTTLIVGTTFLNPNPDSGQLFIAQQLAPIYADMALREPIQIATMEALGIDWLPQYESKVVPNTQMIEISVLDTNPERAQIVASELAMQLILQSPTIGGTETSARQEFIRQQLSSLQNQIQETESNIEELQKSLAGLTSASRIAAVEADIVEQTAKLDSLRSNYASFLANSQEGAVNILTVVEPANLPTRPTGTTKLTIILLAGLVGLSLGIGAAYLLEFLDRTIKTTSDIERIFHLPVIGYISETLDAERATYIVTNPDSVLAENFRLLWSNIEFYRIRKPVKTILITSPSQGNGKTTVASNLALAISLEGTEVLLVDADLRRSAVHRSLELPKAPGLCEVISKRAELGSVLQQWRSDSRLSVITAGEQLPNVTEVVGSNRIATILSELKNQHEVIIIDAPPLIIADSYNLASRADGVIIVMEPGQTTDEQAQAIKEQLGRANAHIIGFVFNKVPEQSAQSYGDNQYRSLYMPRYYDDYVSSRATKEPITASRSKQLTDFFEHGKVPPDVASGVQDAITAIKTQPRNMLNQIQKLKKNKNGNHNQHKLD
ncbi:MAG: polysaccharide biosynthesis tyrosine autokinase [Chloroflexota bacterium]